MKGISEAVLKDGVSQVLNQLGELLNRHAELHGQLLVAAEHKREAIVNGDLEKMEQLLQMEKMLVQEVEVKERERAELIKQACSGLGLDYGKVKLADILAKMEDRAQADRISQIRENLRGILDKLRYRNRQNCELLKASIQHANDFLHLVQCAVNGGELYGRNGKKTGGSLGLLNRQA